MNKRQKKKQAQIQAQEYKEAWRTVTEFVNKTIKSVMSKIKEDPVLALKHLSDTDMECNLKRQLTVLCLIEIHKRNKAVGK
ncbi:hypothetical protein P8864_10440 [Priestia flexa]|uniref:hypothetical protein n=1 Tax=Priestia flexa TaxID=86664 RepID=UPI000C245C52|nr:hypothetical protein [Priestia flexa]MEC0666307.1 hypothetical protein [Priestia flexa]